MAKALRDGKTAASTKATLMMAKNTDLDIISGKMELNIRGIGPRATSMVKAFTSGLMGASLTETGRTT